MEPYRDLLNRVACFADPSTGLVQHSYKGVMTSFFVSVGQSARIERDETITILQRINEQEFKLIRLRKTA